MTDPRRLRQPAGGLVQHEPPAGCARGRARRRRARALGGTRRAAALRRGPRGRRARVRARLREAWAAADAILFSTPEYNGSVPGGLKNAIDWASRPRLEAVLRNKPVAVVGASTGQFGALWAQQDLKRILGIAGARVVGTEIPVARAHERFDNEGRLLDVGSLRAAPAAPDDSRLGSRRSSRASRCLSRRKTRGRLERPLVTVTSA